MLSILKPHRSYGYQEFTGLNPIKYIVLSWLRLRYSIGLIRKDFPGDGQDFPLTLSVDTLLRWQMGHRAAFASAPQGDFNGSDLHWNAWSLSDTKFSIWAVLETWMEGSLAPGEGSADGGKRPLSPPLGLLSFSHYFLMFLLKIIKP